MCSVIVDSLWRLLELGSKEKCNLFFIGTKALVVYDIVSDFLYWNSVREDDDVPVWARTAVLAFACAGILVDAMGSCCICRKSVPDSWGKDQAEASNRYVVAQKKLALAMIVAEDLPQLCRASWITSAYKNEITTWYLVTVFGSLLNILRVVVLSTGYILCERRARRIMVKENRNEVRVRCCRCTLQSYEWQPTGYFGEMGRPTGGSQDIQLCGC